MTTLLGVDGCPKGWCGVFRTRSGSTLTMSAQMEIWMPPTYPDTNGSK